METLKITPDYTKKLPDSEFEVMNAVWGGEAPVTTAYLMEAIGNEKGWKAPTLISFLVRLENRGFVSSVKKGKERYYTPVADKVTYTNLIIKDFFEKYCGGSLISLLDNLYKDESLSDADIDELLLWLKSKY